MKPKRHSLETILHAHALHTAGAPLLASLRHLCVLLRVGGWGNVLRGLAAFLLVSVVVLLIACVGNVGDNLEDGYQLGDVSEGLAEDRAWYCGEGMMGIRRVARAVVAVSTGEPIPDLCKVVDAVVEGE